MEHFPYQNGLLVSYWDTSFSDNNESVHPGNGEVLPIDSHPNPIYKLDGLPWRGRIQTYDSPFSLEKADSFTLHQTMAARATSAGRPRSRSSMTARKFWNATLPTVGVKVPHVGVRMRVVSANGTSMRVRIDSVAAGRVDPTGIGAS